MINVRAVDKIERHVEDALAHGATVLTGGRRLAGDGLEGSNYYAPTVAHQISLPRRIGLKPLCLR